jgi:copper chaperone
VEDAEMENKTVRVPNISCHHCVMTIERELKELEGVVSVNADVETKAVSVEWESPADWAGIEALLSEINYPPE